MDQSPGALELLSSRVDELEKRVHALEHPDETRASLAVQRTVQPSLDSTDSASALETGNLFPIIGRAMLGVAGAYVLRAIAEARVLPGLPVSALAVVYAFAWLIWSSRGRGNLARVVYAGTSALILAPLLWENTLKFHFFTPMVSAGALAAFLTLATLLELRSFPMRSMWIAQSIAVLTTAALAFATRDLLPFVTALLIAVLVSEFARIREYSQPLWPLMVLVADAAVWGLIFIYSGAPTTRTAYPELNPAALIAPASILFVINGAALAVRVLVHQNRISVFETIQVIVAYLLVVAGVLTFGPQQGIVVLGSVNLMLAACAYVATVRYLRHRSEQRNIRVFGAWSAALFLVGSLWTVPRPSAAIVLAIAALAATYFASRMDAGMLEFHGVGFLITAVITARLPRYIFDAVAGTLPQRLTAAMAVVCVCAALAIFIAKREAHGAWQKAFQLVTTILAVCGFIALLVHGALTGAAAFFVLDVHHVAFLRTLTICFAALLIAFSGSRWGRVELTHMSYVLLAFVAAKLLFEDLRHGHMEFIAASIALFAIALIAAPHLVRLGARLRAEVREEAPVHSNS